MSEELNLEFISCFADEASESLERWEALCFELSKSPVSGHYQELFRIAHNLKGGSRSVGLGQFGDFIHRVEDGITLLRDSKVSLQNRHIDLLLGAHKILSQWTTLMREDPHRVPDHQSFIADFGKVFFEQEPHETTVAQAPAVAAAQAPAVSSPPAPGKAAQGPETVRVSADKLDALIQVIGELSIHQSIVWHTKEGQNPKLFLNSLQLGQKLTKELYDKALGLRMQPLQQTFQRLERNILDLSKTLEKSIDVEVLGSDVELDKAVLERILDPLTHIVRNAVDHGVETPVDRQLAEKDPKGRIQLSARKDAFGVEILIKDDGRGLRAHRIREKAVEKGLIRPDQELSPQEIYSLILQPGFSTAEKITDVSGRGVGLDVVNKVLSDLGGQMSIDSEAGLGTTFTITLPTSMSIIEVLIVEIGAQQYAVPVSMIEEVFTSDAPIGIDETKRSYGGHVLPLRDMETLLEGRSKNLAPRRCILICRQGTSRIGLLVGAVREQQPVVIRSLNSNIQGAFGVLGGTILGNGEPGLILDLKSLLGKIFKDVDKQERAA